MNQLYRAIIGLGRSATSIAAGYWTRLEMADSHGRKCAVGQITHHLGYQPDYTSSYDDEGAHLAVRALYDALTDDQLERLGAKCDQLGADASDTYEIFVRVRGDASTASAYDLDVLVIIANDRVMRDEAETKEWFSNAIDLLAKKLPKPIPAETLTVEQIIETAPTVELQLV